MSKRILILSVLILSIMMVGCSNRSNKEESYITISKDDTINTFAMGVNYKIYNLIQGEYNIEIYAREYKYGELKQEHSLFVDKVKIGNGRNLSIGIYEDEYNLFSGISGGYTGNYLEFFGKSKDRGMAMSILDDKKEFKLDTEIPIVAYSIGKEGEGASGVYLHDDLKLETNENDLLIYLQVNKVE